MAAGGQVHVYQAQLTLPGSLARVRAAQRAIERVGGRVEVIAASAPGVTVVRLHLPEPHTPDQFLPGLPFFPE